jgi:VanZ family protein
MNSFIKYNWPSYAWAAIIFYLCMVPAHRLPAIKIPNIDKIAHFSLYFGLTALMYFGWTRQQTFKALHKNTFLKIFFIACAYGLSIEIMQEEFTTTRHFEWLDEAANATGALVSGILSRRFLK